MIQVVTPHKLWFSLEESSEFLGFTGWFHVKVSGIVLWKQCSSTMVTKGLSLSKRSIVSKWMCSNWLKWCWMWVSQTKWIDIIWYNMIHIYIQSYRPKKDRRVKSYWNSENSSFRIFLEITIRGIPLFKQNKYHTILYHTSILRLPGIPLLLYYTSIS